MQKYQDPLLQKSVKDYRIKQILGKGSNAVVYLAVNLKTNQKVALKASSIQDVNSSQNRKRLLRAEISILSSINNQNVIKFIDAFKSSAHVFIVTEYCNMGDASQYLKKKKRLTQEQATYFLKQILNGFKGLHEVRAMHRDFKIDNLLIHNNTIKIGDLGYAKQLQQKFSLTKTSLGTGITKAPEVIDKQPYGMNADIWSLGVVYYQMLFGDYPYKGLSEMDIRKNIKMKKLRFPEDVNISYNAKDFILRCLVEDPRKRISWQEIYDHPLITEKKNLTTLTSQPNFSIQKNKQYYLKNKQMNQQIVYSPNEPFITDGYDETILNNKQKALKIEKIEEKDEIEEQINKIMQIEVEEFEKVLHKKRDNIKFMEMFFIPVIKPYKSQIKAKHNLALFLINKSIFIQLNHFVDEINQKRNKKNENQILNCFFESKKCGEFLDILNKDIDIVYNELCYNIQDLGLTNQFIENQLQDLMKWNNKNWQVIFYDELNQYWHQLAENITSKNFMALMKAMKALQFCMSTEQVSVEVFQKILETLDIEQYQQQIDCKLFPVVQ